MLNRAKWVAIFLGYGLVGLTGDFVADLVAAQLRPGDAPRDADVGVVTDVKVNVDPVISVQVRVDSDRCAYEADGEASATASIGDRLRLDAGSGSLRVEGREGLSEIRVHTHACASEESYLDDLGVSIERSGRDIILSAHYPDRLARRSWGGNDDASLDLVVEVPLGMAADIEDSSGEMEVSGTGDLTIDDSSGSIDVRDIRGSVRIDDSSGGVDVVGVAGDVEIDDGSGGIDVRDVTGSLRVRDGSGSMELSGVGRDIVVDSDGSGSISVRDVGGDFRVRRDGGGSIRYSGVRGQVDIPANKRERRRGR